MTSRRYEALKSVIRPGATCSILIRPDPDSLASALALSAILSKNRAKSKIVLYEPIRRMENRTMVKLLHIPVVPLKDAPLEGCDLLCTVDAQPCQFPDLEVPRWGIVIDHHPLAKGYTADFADVRPGMGATSSMMVAYLADARVRVGERLSTALCYGIMTDTDHFQRPVSREDALAFSRLFPRVNHQSLQVIESKEIPRRQLIYFDTLLQRLQVKNRRAIVHVGAPESADIAVILADFLIRVSGISVAVVSCIAGEKLVIIFRSVSSRRNVGKMAENHFGEMGSAGGHRSAARAEVGLEGLPPDVKVYSADSIERFIGRRLGRPGKPATV